MEHTDYIGKSNAYRIGQELAMVEIRGKDDFSRSQLTDIHSVFFIFSGSITIEIESETHQYTTGNVINIISFHSFRIVSVSPDIQAFQLLYTDTYVKDIFKHGPPFPMEYIGRLMIEPAILLTDDQIQLFNKHLNGLKNIFSNRSHYFFEEKVKCGIWMLIMDLGDITHRIFENQSIEENSDTKKILLMRFMGKLETSINKNRSVGYYASELCVSSQYLERVVKALSKHSAKEWIQQVMISQVNKKLLETNYPIQQLANEFGFIDQQTFTKYYRRIMKVTPTEYRKKAMI